LSTTAFSQSLEADRPDQTETPAIVPVGMFQVENGFTFQKNEAKSYTNSLPSTLWKFGINPKIELRLITEFVSKKNKDTITVGLLPIYVGFKINICAENGIIPKTSLIAHVLMPKVASKNYQAQWYMPKFRFTMQHTLTDKITLGYNLGCEWDGDSAQATFIYTLTTGYSITQKLGLYTELFGFSPSKEIAYHSFDGGFTYLINNNFMVDLSSSIGITDNAPKHYMALGFSFRL
jgi:hypothetical protein